MSTVLEPMQRVRATRSVERGRIGGHRKPVLTGDEDDLRRLVEARKGITLAELRAEVVARGGPTVSLWTVGRCCAGLGLGTKKAP